ncbi:MAG: hypothetical protein HOQ05_06230 [Corynebacteriales bacterium]|nr:hypothetical protein [Mycobacteriales bacterium]
MFREYCELMYEAGKVAARTAQRDDEATSIDYVEALMEAEEQVDAALPGMDLTNLPLVAGFISELSREQLAALARNQPQLMIAPFFPVPARDVATSHIFSDLTIYGTNASTEPLPRGEGDDAGMLTVRGDTLRVYFGATSDRPTSVVTCLLPDSEYPGFGRQAFAQSPLGFYAHAPEGVSPLVVGEFVPQFQNNDQESKESFLDHLSANSDADSLFLHTNELDDAGDKPQRVIFVPADHFEHLAATDPSWEQSHPSRWLGRAIHDGFIDVDAVHIYAANKPVNVDAWDLPDSVSVNLWADRFPGAPGITKSPSQQQDSGGITSASKQETRTGRFGFLSRRRPRP